MKNGGDNSNKRTEQRGKQSSESPRQSVTDGSNIWRDESTIPGTVEQVKSGEFRQAGSNEPDSNASTANQRITLQSGYYFTPSGSVERIPDGYQIRPDGRLSKQRKQRSDRINSSDGNSHRDRSNSDQGEEFATEDFLLEKPLKVGGRRKKKLSEEKTKVTMVTMLAVASSAIFSSISLLTKHDHWALESKEGRALAEALNEAFETLPSKYYETILAIIEKWVPWVNLIFVISAIILPRIEESAKRVEATRYRAPNPSDNGNAGTKNYSFSSEASFGFNQ